MGEKEIGRLKDEGHVVMVLTKWKLIIAIVSMLLVPAGSIFAWKVLTDSRIQALEKTSDKHELRITKSEEANIKQNTKIDNIDANVQLLLNHFNIRPIKQPTE